MDIFKLFFEHDLRLDQLRERQLDRSTQDITHSLEDFMRPDPTYSKFYFTGTRLPDSQFGLDQLENYSGITEGLNDSLQEYHLFLNTCDDPISLEQALEQAAIGEAMIFSRESASRWDPERLRVDSGSNVGHKKEALADVLEAGDLVLYKEQAHHGFDLHLFSKKNIYSGFFYTFRDLLSANFRFFSINNKRIRSEQKFYFETWALERPPHGVEEVFENTRI